MTPAVPTVWTIGHSTRPLDQYLQVLTAHGIEAVADVRRFPGSRRLPHFQTDALAAALDAHGVAYLWLPALGGRRRSDASATGDSAWRHPAFRAYAEHLATDEFAEGLAELLAVAHGLRTAVMCAEVLWWRCHRRLIADVLVSLGHPVIHVRDERAAEPHRLVAPARLEAGMLVYTPAPETASVR